MLKPFMQRLTGAAVVTLLVPHAAFATDKKYVGPLTNPNNVWNQNSNWQTTGGAATVVPTASDFARLEGGAGVVNVIAASVNGGMLLEYAPGNPLLFGALEVNQAGSTMTSAYEEIGVTTNARGRYVQSAGTHTVSGYVILGHTAATAAGTFNLSGGTLLLTATTGQGFVVGNFGTGTFSQSGGTATINGALRAGLNSGGDGTILLSAGLLSAASLALGDAGTGTLLQSGGTFNTGTNGFGLGRTAAGVGYYGLSGTGVLNSQNTGIGFLTGSGTFVQSGGIHTVGSAASSSGLFVGQYAGATGNYALSAGTLNVFGSLSVGYEGFGTFDQSGGNVSLSSSLVLGTFGSSPTGIYLLKGGNLTAADEILGSSGSGSFLQTGGVNTLSRPDSLSSLTLGAGVSGKGFYQLAGGRLEGIYKEFVGSSGAGTFVQSGGLHQIGSISNATSGSLFLGAGTASKGTYLLSGGTLNVNGLVSIGLGDVGNFININGNFTQTGGMHSIGSSPNLGFLVLGAGSNNFGNYTLSNTGTLELMGFEEIRNGLFTQAGGTQRITKNPTQNDSGGIEVGSAFGGFATYNLNGGSLTLANTLRVINNGTFNYNGGTISVDTIEIAAGGRVAMSSGGNKVLKTNVLTIAPGGTLDVSDDFVVVDYTGPIGTLKNDTLAHLANGRILSSLSDATHRIGYGDNAQLGYTTFGGKPVDSTSLLIRFTLAGDATLDGKVDVADLGALASHWQQSGFWTDGDFTYDGTVNVADLGLLATNWQSSLSLSSALAALGLSDTNLPEPATLGTVFVGFALARRRR